MGIRELRQAHSRLRKRDWENLVTGIVSKRGRSSADAATCSGTRFGSRRARWRTSIERGDELEHRIALEVSAQAERRGAALDVANFLERRLARHQGRIHYMLPRLPYGTAAPPCCVHFQAVRIDASPAP